MGVEREALYRSIHQEVKRQEEDIADLQSRIDALATWRSASNEKAFTDGFDFMDRLSKQDTDLERTVLDIRSTHICGRARAAFEKVNATSMHDGAELGEKVEALRGLLSQLPTGYLHSQSPTSRARTPRKLREHSEKSAESPKPRKSRKKKKKKKS